MFDGWSSSKHRLTSPDGSSVNVFMDLAYCAGHCIPHEEALEMVAPYTYICLLYYCKHFYKVSFLWVIYVTVYTFHRAL